MLPIHVFQTAKRILFGVGAAEKVGEEAKKLGFKKAGIICGPTVRKVGLVNVVTESLEKAGVSYEVWDGVEPEPRVEVADRAAEFARQGKFDVLIGVGGGSALDTTKAAAVLMNNPGSVKQYLGAEIPNPPKPMILMPTTSGTGSEVSNAAVFAIPEEEFKYVLYSPLLYPDLAIVDPKLTMTMPPKVTAQSGMDALCHAVEAYVSLQASPVTDVLALKAIELIAKSLRKAYANGDNLEARRDMAYASLIAGLAFGNAGTVLAHAAGHAFSYRYHVPHGIAVAVMLPYVLEFNIISNLEKHVEIACRLGENVSGLSMRDAALRAALAVKKLLIDLDLPTNLKDLGFKKDEVELVAKDVFKSKAHVARNPRKVTMDGVIKLYERAYEGILESEKQV